MGDRDIIAEYREKFLVQLADIARTGCVKNILPARLGLEMTGEASAIDNACALLESFTDVGERVEEGQTLCIVEAMKMPSEGKMGHNLAWMVARGLLVNVLPHGYWPAGDVRV